MFGFVVYSWPKKLSDCWWLPMQQMGFTTQLSPSGGTVKHLGVDVRVHIGKDDSATIHGWSFLRKKRQRLGLAVERVLLASGAKAFCKPHSTNLIYQIGEPPNRSWLEDLKLENLKTIFSDCCDHDKQNYPCGRFQIGKEAVSFWTGAAIDLETKSMIHHIALGADASKLGDASRKNYLNSIDLILTARNARRIEVQRALDR
jgi:hypothetical protein